MGSRFAFAAGLAALSLAPSSAAAPPAKDCEVMAYIIHQARVDIATLKGQQVAKGRCTARGAEFGCAWAFPGDGYGYAEEEAARLNRCVAAYPTAQKSAGKRGSTSYAIEPDVNVLIPAPEIDSNGNWAVSFRIKVADAR